MLYRNMAAVTGPSGSGQRAKAAPKTKHPKVNKQIHYWNSEGNNIATYLIHLFSIETSRLKQRLATIRFR